MATKQPTPFTIRDGLVSFLKPGEAGDGVIQPVGKLYVIQGIDPALHHLVHQAWTQHNYKPPEIKTSADPKDWKERYNYRKRETVAHSCITCSAFKPGPDAEGNGRGRCLMFDAPVVGDMTCSEWSKTWKQSSDDGWSHFESNPTFHAEVPGEAPGMQPVLQGEDKPAQSVTEACPQCGHDLTQGPCEHCLPAVMENQVQASQPDRQEGRDALHLVQVEPHVGHFNEGILFDADQGLDDGWDLDALQGDAEVHVEVGDERAAALVDAKLKRGKGLPLGLDHHVEQALPVVHGSVAAGGTGDVAEIPLHAGMGLSPTDRLGIGSLALASASVADQRGVLHLAQDTPFAESVKPDSTYWVWLNGDVAFDRYPWRAAQQLALKHYPDKVAYIENTIARNATPLDIPIALGEVVNNRPQIYLSNVDRNHVWDAVMRALDTRTSRTSSIAVPTRTRNPMVAHTQHYDTPRTLSREPHICIDCGEIRCF